MDGGNVLYPALLSYSHTRETLTEGLHEHDSAENIANELRESRLPMRHGV